MKSGNQSILYIFVGAFFSTSLMSEVVEVNVPYHCFMNSGCGYQPQGDSSTNCFKEKVCKHELVIANQSSVRWFYSIIDQGLIAKNSTFIYEALPPLSFIEYSWKRSSGTVTKYRSEWDPKFDRGEDPMPEDPAEVVIKDQYILLALTESNLKAGIKGFMTSSDLDSIQNCVIVKLIATTDAPKKESATSTLVILGAEPNAQSIEFTSGASAAKLDKQDMSKVIPQNRTYKP